MTVTISPPFSADSVVLENVTIKYDPVWNGSAWVIDPTAIVLFSYGILSDAVSGSRTSNINTSVPFANIPAGGQTALQNLFGFAEQLLADSVTP